MADGALRTAIRYGYQLRYLTSEQIYHRLRQRFWRARPPQAVATPAFLPSPGAWHRPALMPASYVGDNRFRLLGQERAVVLPVGWQDRAPGKKWLMELHTFNFLQAENARDCAPLLENWVRHNADIAGPGWHPYITSQRIGNWLRWALGGQPLDDPLRASLARQLRYLCSVLSYDEGDHKLLNQGRTLLLAACTLDDPERDRWRTLGLKLLRRGLATLLGTDGGYIELCPSYHCALLNDLLDVLNLYRAYGETVPQGLVQAIAAARRWLAVMCHPDGRLALFNDTAFDVVAGPGELNSYAERLGLPPLAAIGDGLVHLADSGFARLANGEAVVLADIGPIGPDHLASHGHADSLGFEMSLAGRRLVVDTGLFTYEQMPERVRLRGTEAHNTVVVDGRNSSDVWGLFKVGRRARVHDVAVGEEGPAQWAGATHDGFSRLLAPLFHRREWHLGPGCVLIRDTVSGKGMHQLQVAFHLHPDIDAERVSEQRFALVSRRGERLAELALDEALAVATAPYDHSPRFGERLAATRIVGSLTARLPAELTCRISW